ncbi:type II toxin-antitoxin system PemK/MazF family toxin [Helicobacter pylori]|nr:type II toxin-antitoxin system PemK/MazF family toxin [Helicobacter pylori]
MDIYYKNRYNKGHEQREERPYFVIYENKDFFLAFPQTTKNKKGKKYPSHKNYIIDEENETIEVMIDQLQVVPKVQVLENNTMGRSLALALQKVSISRFASAHSWKCYQTQSTQ